MFNGFKEYLRYIFIFLFDKVSHFDKKVIFVVKKPEVIHVAHPDDMAIANLITLV